MADWMLPFRQAARRAPSVRVNSPVLARYLDDLAQQQRIADAAADARNLDIHFGRIKPDDPFAGVGDDPISDMVAATGAPRRWLEEADYNKTIESMMPSGPQEPFADALRRNERSRLLVNNRLDRLTPEEQASSLGIVSRQAEADAAMRRADDIAQAAANRDAMLTAAVAAAAGGGLAYVGSEAMDDERDARMAARNERLDDFVRTAVDDIQIVDDSPVELAEALEPVDEIAMISGLLEDDGEMDVVMDSPEQAVDNSPGPDIPVGMNRDLEDLPGPQMRSVKALMAAGIPEGRAMAIIVKGSSMSPDEYRMVTGGRR